MPTNTKFTYTLKLGVVTNISLRAPGGVCADKIEIKINAKMNIDWRSLREHKFEDILSPFPYRWFLLELDKFLRIFHIIE